MNRTTRTFVRPALLALLTILGPALHAGATSAQETRPLTFHDYGDWARVTQVVLSADGAWMTWARSPNEGDATLHVQSVPSGNVVHEAVNGSGAAFSADGRWVAFLSSPPEDEADAAREAGDAVTRTLHLVELASGEAEEIPGVQGFTFSEDGRYLAVHRVRADEEADHRGSDLLLRDLSDGGQLNLGNVTEFAFNEPATHLAYLVDAAEQVGNGAYLVTPVSGRTRALVTDRSTFEDLTWNEDGDALAFLSGETPEGMTQRDNDLHVVRGLAIGASGVASAAGAATDGIADGRPATAPRVHNWDPGSDPTFPDGYVVSQDAPTRWSPDGARVVVGVREQAEEWEEPEDGANVDVWHWKDEDIQSRQMVTAPGDRRFTYTSLYTPPATADADGSGRFARLATEAMPRVDLTEDGRWGIGRRDEPYRSDVDAEGGRFDLVRMDLAEAGVGDDGMSTGSTFASGVRRTHGPSPDGNWYVYAQNEQILSVNLESLETVNLTETTGVDYMNREYDLMGERPAYPLGGWTEDGRILMHTRWDVHAVPLGGGPAQSLTNQAGARDSIRYRVVQLDREADWVDPADLLVSAYGEWTKRSGYARIRPGRDPEQLLYDDEMVRSVRKAEDADRVIFTRQTFRQFPDWWAADLDFRSPERLTDANPHIEEFAWGDRVLIEYTDGRGNHLQGTLTLPPDYEPSQRYPMVVYFYEQMSQNHHLFSLPVWDDRPHASTYASNGYLFFMPDIAYDDGLPGMSALDDITSATRAVIDQGYADPDRIGLQGHSWGGYQSSFIVTQTDMFAAVVTGAPLTNLMSMYNIVYKRTGSPNGAILEWSQGRFGVTPWEDFELYISQSPVHQAEGITTPFLILHGTEDGAVDWLQGLEFYTAARRLEKEVILLSYPDEPHHLQEEANQKDFQRRMWAYFDHHLRDAEAPRWMTEGVPHLEKGRY